MSITTYAELQTEIADWLDRSDLGDAIPDFIALTESTMNHVLRSPFMVSSATAAITAGNATLPTDALELIYTQVNGSDDLPLEQVTPDQLVALRRTRLKTAGDPRFFAVIGREAKVAPIPAGATTLDFDYYAKIPALSVGNTSNWLLEQAPHIYLYMSLLYAADYLSDVEKKKEIGSVIPVQIQNSIESGQKLTHDDLKIVGESLRGDVVDKLSTLGLGK